MRKVKSIKYNFIMNFILTASGFIFPLITFPYVSRVLLAEGNGKIAFATSIANYFMMIASLGIPTYGIRACAVVRDNKEKLSKTVQELIIIHAIVTFFSLLCFFISVLSVDKLYQDKELMFINGCSIFLNVLGVNWLYSALEEYQYITVRSLFFKVASVILMFALVHQKEDYIIYGAITVFATAGSNVLNFINLRKHISFRKSEQYNFRQHIKPIMIFFAQSVAITVYTNLDTVMLGFMKGDEEVGLYAAAVKVKNILCSLVTSLGTVLLPRLSYYISNKQEDEFIKTIHKAVEFVLLISLPLTAYFCIMAEESILLLSGAGYVGATSAMFIIVPTIVFIGLSNITGMQVLTPLKKEKYVLVSVIVGAIVDLVLNAMFIPLWGAAGAALGTLAAELAVLVVQIDCIRNKFGYSVFEKIQIGRLLVIMAITSCFLIFMNGIMDFPVLIKLVINCVVMCCSYIILCIIFKIKFVNEVIKQVIVKRKNADEN